MATRAERLARDMKRELVQVCQQRTHYFDRQIANGRQPIILPGSAETGVTFKLRDAEDHASETPDAYVVLREERSVDTPGRPRRYWYGLVHRLPSGEELYEGFHCHPEPEDPGSVDVHFQVDLDGGQIARKKTSLVHVAVAIDELMTRYFVRLEALEHPVGRRRRRTGP